MAKIQLLAVALALLSGACGLALVPAQADDGTGGPRNIDGLIVKFRATAPRFRERILSAADALAMSQAAAMPLAAHRAMSGNRHVLKFAVRMNAAEATAAAHRLSMHADIEYAVPDRRKFPHRLPNDELFAWQWSYTDPQGGINLPAAWDITTGAAGVIVAIADTGSRPHPDSVTPLAGYDFISDAYSANDGDGRDADPLDTGDGVTADEALSHPGLTAALSSWHGESVAGIIGAATDNGFGIAGMNWNSQMLHVRVLGKGGGNDSDILDGVSWAAGLPVPGVPANPHPAQIINMSLGGDGPCGAAYQDMFDTLIGLGKLIVVSAGNSGADVAGTSPANCLGAIVVAATGRSGARASYSNIGTVAGAITLAAPGGDGAPADRIISLSNAGSYGPASESYAWKQGTSFAAPQVSATAALMLSANPALTPSQVMQILRDTVRPFPAGTADDCTAVRCGAGILDVHAAVLFARQMTSPAVVPAAGWWWNPHQGGPAFMIEQRGNRLLMASNSYDSSGTNTWYASGPGSMSGANYLGTNTRYAGGQTLSGSYRRPSASGAAGDVALNFASPTQGSLNWPGGALAIERYDFGPGGSAAPQPAGAPETGWWWATAEGGRGFAIEVQGNAMLVAGYMYDALGNPVWYTSGPAPMTNASTYQGQWQQFADVQTPGGITRAPRPVAGNAGSLTIQFSSSSAAMLTLPDGRQLAIERYRF